MAESANKMKKPESNKKKIAIIIAVVAVVCLSASGGLYLVFSGGGDERDELGEGRRPRFNDANLPNTRKQSYEDVMAYKNSDKFKKLSTQEQMMYSMRTFRQVDEHNIETYFSLPKEQKTAFLDKVIDEMQQNMKNMAQMPRPQWRRDANEANDPNRAARRQERMAQRNNPSRMRAMRERGNPEEQAKQRQFRDAMQKRMQQRGIQMPRMGGPGGGRGR